MSTTTISDTQTTDNNDDIKEQPTFFGKIVQFFISLIIILIIISGHITCGSLVLYGCKISQSNILPKDINCYPYTDTKPNIQNISTNIFPTFTDPPLPSIPMYVVEPLGLTTIIAALVFSASKFAIGSKEMVAPRPSF